MSSYYKRYYGSKVNKKKILDATIRDCCFAATLTMALSAVAFGVMYLTGTGAWG